MRPENAFVKTVRAHAAPSIRGLSESRVFGTRERPAPTLICTRLTIRSRSHTLPRHQDTPMFTCAKAAIGAIVAQFANMD